mmetsp:Transcript_13289/g.23637  ORF Transcript_13289/g.23637 Transcript_13289/m.23637 type:complete len:128 (-) Transcript_13289:100-483(-)
MNQTKRAYVVQQSNDDEEESKAMNPNKLKKGAWFMGGFMGFLAGSFVGIPIIGTGIGAYTVHRSVKKSVKKQPPQLAVAEVVGDVLQSLSHLNEKHRVSQRFMAAGQAAYAELTKPTEAHKSSMALS